MTSETKPLSFEKKLQIISSGFVLKKKIFKMTILPSEHLFVFAYNYIAEN